VVGLGHEGNTKEENNSDVVFTRNIHGSAGKEGSGEGGAVAPPAPIPLNNRLLEGFLMEPYHEMDIFFDGLNILISTFCVCADGF
jgi:hypothetical protein